MEKERFEEQQREMAMEEIRSIVREQGGKFQFDKCEGCVGVRVQDYVDEEPRSFRVGKILIDEDDDVVLFGDNFSEEGWEAEMLWNVIDDGVLRIADAIRRITQKDYISLIDELRNEMQSELWSVIEAHRDDERCDCPRRFDEVSFTHKHFCEVDLKGYTYDVDAVRLDRWTNGDLRLNFKSSGHWYTLSNVEEIAGILHAVRNTLDMSV